LECFVLFFWQKHISSSYHPKIILNYLLSILLSHTAQKNTKDRWHRKHIPLVPMPGCGGGVGSGSGGGGCGYNGGSGD
jgi:hypothetical protein